MKYYIDGVIVVEGTSDSAFLSSFIDCLFVETNGYDLPKEEIDFLNHIPSNKKVIILTDSDEAGKQIRQRLNDTLNAKIDVSVDIAQCNKNNKHGVAECNKGEIVNVLKEHFSKAHSNISYLTVGNLQDYGIVDKKSREYACQELHLGKCNNKTFIKRFGFIGYKLNDLKKVMEGYYGNK